MRLIFDDVKDFTGNIPWGGNLLTSMMIIMNAKHELSKWFLIQGDWEKETEKLTTRDGIFCLNSFKNV